MSKCQCIAYLAAAVLVPLTIGVAAYSFLGARTPARVPIIISPETTFVTAPLKADGTVDYATAINLHYGSQATLQNNAAVLLWEVIHEDVTPQFEARYRSALGMPTGPSVCDFAHFDLRHYESETVGRLIDEQVEATRRLWSECEFPEVYAWVQANEAALLKVEQACQRPLYFSPIIRDPDEPIYNTHFAAYWPLKQVGYALAARAMLRLASDQFDDAWADLVTTLQLGRLLTRGGHLAEWLVGDSIQKMAHAGLCLYLQVAPQSLKSVQARLRQLASVPAAGSALDKLHYAKRLAFLDWIIHVADPGFAIPSGVRRDENIFRFVRPRCDINRVLRIANKTYDEYQRINQLSDAKQRVDARSQFHQFLEMPLEKWEESNGSMSEYFLMQDPDLLFANHLFQECTTTHLDHNPLGASSRQKWDLIQLGFRLAAFHAQHGEYPQALSELSPDGQHTIPLDSFTGEPLKYQPSGSGYLLYSLGPNAEDNQGRTYDQRRETDDWQADDITLRIRVNCP